MNVLLITLDQFRGDCLSAAGHEVVRTPNLDYLAANGVRFARHYSQAAPCGPGRAALYTGMYQMNNRVVANGTPLDGRFDNLALAGRRAGYLPTLFGYTDQAVDPRSINNPDDPRLSTYEGVLPGFEHELDLTGDHAPLRAWLVSLGYDSLPEGVGPLLASERNRPAHHSVSAFLTNEAAAWITQQSQPWFAHLSYLRPHPPYSAAGNFSTMYSAATKPTPIVPTADVHPFHRAALANAAAAAPQDSTSMAWKQSQYYGMISEVDEQLGRLWNALRAAGCWDDTLIIVTADHGEQMGDHGLMGKLGYWNESYHIPGIVRDPRRPVGHGRVVRAFTENVDIMPTLCEAFGLPIPGQCDGRSLTDFLAGDEPRAWRTAAHWEFDWRDLLIACGAFDDPLERRLEQLSLAVLRTDHAAYVQFGDGSFCCFDLVLDPTWRTEITDPARVLVLAQEMLIWRSQHTDRTLTGMLMQDGGIGRWPVSPAAPLRHSMVER